MSFITDEQINTGDFVPTTQIWNIEDIQKMDINSPAFKKLTIFLYENINIISLVLNRRVSGYAITQEFVSGKLFFYATPTDPMDLRQVEYRPGFIKVINTGALGAGVSTIPHGLNVTSIWRFMHIVGTATLSTTPVAYPIPSPTIAVHVTGTDVVINNTSGVSFDDSQVTLEYVKY